MRTTKQRREHWLRELDKGFIPQLDDIANLITDLEDALGENERLRKALDSLKDACCCNVRDSDPCPNPYCCSFIARVALKETK